VFPDELFPEPFLPIRRTRITGSSGLELIVDISERDRKYGVYDCKMKARQRYKFKYKYKFNPQFHRQGLI